MSEPTQMQYIGARYVIKVYENSQNQNSAEWEAYSYYEPLTMVTYNNNSYLSKKAVPATVGNPAQNGKYWAVTGAYNGQIASLQTQIQNLEEIVDGINDKLNNEKIILMADSYGVDGAQWSGGTAWTTFVAQRYPESTIIARGQAGFATSVNPFLTNLQSTQIDDKDSITQILLMAGANDANGLHYGTITESSLRSAITAFMTYAKANFPNAEIKIAFIGNHQNIEQDQYELARKIYKEETFGNGGLYFSDGERILENKALSTDTLHPNQTASSLFAQFGICCLNNMPYCIDYTVSDSLTWSDMAATSGAHIDVQFTNVGAHIILNGSAFSGNTWLQLRKNTAVTLSNEDVEICELNNAPVASKYLNTPIAISNGTSIEIGTLIYHDSKIYVKALKTLTASETILIGACDLFVPYN